MTFKHKLSCRLALMRDALLLFASVAAIQSCEVPGVNPTDPAHPVVQVIVVPDSLSLDPAQHMQFAAFGKTTSGDSSAVTVSWSATGGSITPAGMFAADTAAGDFLVSGTSAALKLSASSRVHIRPRPVASVGVTPASPSVSMAQTIQLAATLRDANGSMLSGRPVTWASSNSAAATVNGGGLLTGVAAGSATITAMSEGKSGAAAITVTQVPAQVASVSVSPAPASVTVGQTIQLTAAPRDASGNTLSGRVVLWASSNTAAATVNGSGLVSGVGAGSATITATSEGKSGTAAVAVTLAPAPVASVSVSPASSNVTAGQTAQLTATPRDASGSALAGRVVTWGSSNTAVATVNGSGFVTGVGAGSATITATSEGKSGTAVITGTAASGGGTILFQESFEDNAFTSRGWYDNTSPFTTAAQHTPGSTRALEMHFTQGSTTPVSGGSVRHLFTPTPTLYISYWVKYSDNWVGSGQRYHPHEFTVMSDLDGDYDGPSNNWLTVYVEQNYQNGGIPRLQMQDNKAINTSFGAPPFNLIGITENRSTGGCNGVVETNVVTSCFSAPPWYNDKEMIASRVWFQPTPGPGYKGNWNHVEAYFAINSIAGGIGQANGVAQYWFNGTLAIDRHDILFRTGARPSINFHQFLIAVYIGDGSPVDQYMWVDDLVVATAKP